MPWPLFLESCHEPGLGVARRKKGIVMGSLTNKVITLPQFAMVNAIDTCQEKEHGYEENPYTDLPGV